MLMNRRGLFRTLIAAVLGQKLAPMIAKSDIDRLMDNPAIWKLADGENRLFFDELKATDPWWAVSAPPGLGKSYPFIDLDELTRTLEPMMESLRGLKLPNIVDFDAEPFDDTDEA